MGVNMGSGYETYDLRGEVLDLSDMDGDFDCLACEDGGVVLHGSHRGELCTCQRADALEEDADWSDVEADADTFESAGWGMDEDYGYFGGDEGW